MIDPFRDDTFGPLEWDPLLDCWLGGIDYPSGLHTEVAIWLPDGDLAAGLHQARCSLAWLREHEESARRAIAGQMLELYNEVWSDEDPITEAEFIRRIELMRIGFESTGSLLLSYDDQGMFGGHVIDGLIGTDRSFGGFGLVG